MLGREEGRQEMDKLTRYEEMHIQMKEQEEFHLETVSIRLARDAPIYSKHRITKPMDAVDVVGSLLCEMDREVVCVINLKSDGTPINCHFASMGALNYAAIHPRELLKASILSNAANMMLVHNHPSENLHPSAADIALTDRMIQVTGLVGIPLLDHIIVGGDNRQFFSLREKGLIKNPAGNYAQAIEDVSFERDILDHVEVEDIEHMNRKGRSR